MTAPCVGDTCGEELWAVSGLHVCVSVCVHMSVGKHFYGSTLYRSKKAGQCLVLELFYPKEDFMS